MNKHKLWQDLQMILLQTSGVILPSLYLLCQWVVIRQINVQGCLLIDCFLTEYWTANQSLTECRISIIGVSITKDDNSNVLSYRNTFGIEPVNITYNSAGDIVIWKQGAHLEERVYNSKRQLESVKQGTDIITRFTYNRENGYKVRYTATLLEKNFIAIKTLLFR